MPKNDDNLGLWIAGILVSIAGLAGAAQVFLTGNNQNQQSNYTTTASSGGSALPKPGCGCNKAKSSGNNIL